MLQTQMQIVCEWPREVPYWENLAQKVKLALRENELKVACMEGSVIRDEQRLLKIKKHIVFLAKLTGWLDVEGNVKSANSAD